MKEIEFFLIESYFHLSLNFKKINITRPKKITFIDISKIENNKKEELMN